MTSSVNDLRKTEQFLSFPIFEIFFGVDDFPKEFEAVLMIFDQIHSSLDKHIRICKNSVFSVTS